MKGLTLNESLEDVKRNLLLPRWNYSFELDSWFRPDDVVPHAKNYLRLDYLSGKRAGDGGTTIK